MKKVIAIIICLVILFTYPAKILAAQESPKETELFAKAAVLMDGDSGRVLYSKNGSEALANASTTKILTCIIALENCDLEQIAEVSGCTGRTEIPDERSHLRDDARVL